jgi:ketosteroid isomerase-like protein
VMARLNELGSWFERIAFADRRVSLVDGDTTFVQTNGDFLTVDGYAYRNVYVFRFDWRDEKMISWEEYANPVIIRQLEERNA